MIDMLQNAKDLINKGKALNDSDLVQMGMDLLEQYSPKHTDDEELWNLPVSSEKRGTMAEIVLTPVYICENCGHKMPIDKPGRKRCPECKKHKLIIVEPTPVPEPEEPKINPNRIDAESFNTQIRGQKSDRIHYDEEGNPDGIIRRSEQVEGVTNIWKDDGIEEHDDANELLKKFTKISPRTRKPPKLVTLVCENCKKVEHVHPIHSVGKSRHLCGKCIRRRSQY